MHIAARSFAKINIGLRIGARRQDGFHELRTIYQTLALHDQIRIDIQRGTGIEVRSKHARVPADGSNTCYRMAERVLRTLRTRGRITITIEKSLPVQGGLGGASSNAATTMLALERALKSQLPPDDKLRIASEIGSDVPLFLLGGTVLGVGHGEEVYPAPDLPGLDCVIATPEIGVSTVEAFALWDKQFCEPADDSAPTSKLTAPYTLDTIKLFSRSVFAWLSGSASGVPTQAGGDRAEALLLDLVRAGIENDFERVVFPKHPELRQVKRVLEREGAKYASLSGSGSTVYGLFSSATAAKNAAVVLITEGIPAQVTKTLPRREYWKQIFVSRA